MIILDTNVVSELMRPRVAPSVAAWASQYSSDDLYSTSITLAEILYGIEILPAGRRKSELLAGAEQLFGVVFGRRILAFDEDAAHQFSQIAAQRRRTGKPIAELEAQIAAIVQVHGAALATRNTNDFLGCGIRLMNPWLD